MPLSQNDRIAFSRKIVAAPFEVATVQQSKDILVRQKQIDIETDLAHKNLVDSKTFIINNYQPELNLLDGNQRNTLTEQDIIDSAQQKLGNFFYPNDPNVLLPSLAPNVWTKTKPFANTKAVGKNYNESYTLIDSEQKIIDDIQDLVTILEGFPLITRVTGESCTTDPGPPPTDNIGPDAAAQAAMANLVTRVNAWKTSVTSQSTSIYLAETNPTLLAQNQAAYNYIVIILLPAINLWLSYPDFNDAHGQTSCASFNAYNPALLGDTKGQTGPLNALKSALTARESTLATRIAQVSGYLGSIVQDLNTGEVTGGSGVYLDRFRFIQLRLNLLGGSLTSISSIDRAIQAQDEQVANILNAAASYESILKASIFTAPSNGTKVLHVKNASGISAGDRVYVASETQPEISLYVESVVGNVITVGNPVPAKYRPDELARIYKDLT